MTTAKAESISRKTLPAQPGRKSPELNVKLVGGGCFDLHNRYGDNSALIIFYRGLHCPKCKEQLQALDRSIAEFSKRGISLIAISMDSEKKAVGARDDWKISHGIHFGYGLTRAQARDWGLYLSIAEFDSEPERFTEPGLFLVDSNDDIYAGWVQSTPFARPACTDILKAVDYVRDRHYPPRGKAA